MLSALIVALIGLGLIFVEFFVPGGVLAILGALALVASTILLFMATGSVTWIVVYLVALGLATWLICRIAVYSVRASAKQNSFFLEQDQSGFQAASFDPQLIGRKGVAFTELKPAGHIIVEGQKWQAVSFSGYIAKGKEVVILRGERAYYIVKELQKESS